MPDRNRYAAIIAGELTPLHGEERARALAARIVKALDEAAADTPAQGFAQGDVVQLVRGSHAGALLIVSEASAFGLDAYAPLLEGALSYRRAPFADFLHTGGRAPFLPAPSPAPVRGQAGTLNMGAAHGVR